MKGVGKLVKLVYPNISPVSAQPEIKITKKTVINNNIGLYLRNVPTVIKQKQGHTLKKSAQNACLL